VLLAQVMPYMCSTYKPKPRKHPVLRVFSRFRLIIECTGLSYRNTFQSQRQRSLNEAWGLREACSMHSESDAVTL
jgi:hypothetical protein